MGNLFALPPPPPQECEFTGRDLLLLYAVINSLPWLSQQSHFSILRGHLLVFRSSKTNINDKEIVNYEIYANDPLWESAVLFKQMHCLSK